MGYVNERLDAFHCTDCFSIHGQLGEVEHSFRSLLLAWSGWATVRKAQEVWDTPRLSDSILVCITPGEVAQGRGGILLAQRSGARLSECYQRVDTTSLFHDIDASV